MNRTWIVRILIPVALIAIGIFYYNVSPENTVWVPKCPWWMLTNTYCPSCGVQRFLHLVLIGEFTEAFLMNPFLLLALPYVGLAVLGKWYNVNGVFDNLNRFLYSRQVLLTYAVIFMIWWGIRIVFNI